MSQAKQPKDANFDPLKQSRAELNEFVSSEECPSTPEPALPEPAFQASKAIYRAIVEEQADLICRFLRMEP